jgi:hypothetical protein
MEIPGSQPWHEGRTDGLHEEQEERGGCSHQKEAERHEQEQEQQQNMDMYQQQQEHQQQEHFTSQTDPRVRDDLHEVLHTTLESCHLREMPQDIP